MLYEHQTSQGADKERHDGVFYQGRAGELRHPHPASAPRVSGRPSGYRQDRHHGAGGAGAGRGAAELLHDPPYPPERAGPAVHLTQGLRWRRVRHLRVHHERDHRLRVRYDGDHRQAGGHPVSGRDQLRVGNTVPHHAAIPAIQGLRPPPCAGRLDRGDGRQPAGVQQLRP